MSYIYLLDNDKPKVTLSKPSLVENRDNVTLTCVSDTNDSGATFEWKKDNETIDGASSNTYFLPDNKRSNSGSYQCKVKTNIVPTTQISDAKIVTFLCKLYLL